MADVLFTSEIVVGAFVAAVLIFLAVTFVRRRSIVHSGDVSLCAVRPDSHSRWRPGLLRLGTHTLDWFPLFGVTTKPHCRWERTSLRLGVGPGPGLGRIQHPLIGEAVTVPFSAVEAKRGPVNAELAIGPDHYPAMRAWVEAAPPGARPVSS